jgi:hypothetical protein
LCFGTWLHALISIDRGAVCEITEFVQHFWIVGNVQDQEDLQQAAAAIARLTPPSVPVLMDKTKEMSEVPSIAGVNGLRTAAEKLKDLEKRVEEAGIDALTFGSDGEDEPASWNVQSRGNNEKSNNQ